MKKSISLMFITGSLGIILGQFGIWNALMLFILVGALPGTSVSLSPLAMLAAFGCVTLIGLRFVIGKLEVTPNPTPRGLPKKRYSRI